VAAAARRGRRPAARRAAARALPAEVEETGSARGRDGSEMKPRSRGHADVGEGEGG